MPCLLHDTLEVSEDLWMVALVRKPGGRDSEHGFILVEGKNEEGRTILRRYDLFYKEENHRQCEIHVKEENVADALARQKLQNDILKGDAVNGKSWQISKTKAEVLHQKVLADQQKPELVYNKLGNVSSLPKSAPTSEEKTIARAVDAVGSNPTSAILVHGTFAPSGHNCFTWSREKLRELNVPTINHDLPKRPEELVVSMTSRLLEKESSSPAITKSDGICSLM